MEQQIWPKFDIMVDGAYRNGGELAAGGIFREILGAQ
jgi:hypothetical protein